ATRDIIIAGLLGLAGGFVWEKYLSRWAKANLATSLAKAGGWFRNQAPWLERRFGRTVAENVTQLGLRSESQGRRERLEAAMAVRPAARGARAEGASGSGAGGRRPEGKQPPAEDADHGAGRRDHPRGGQLEGRRLPADAR